MKGDRELLTLKALLHVCKGFNIKLTAFFNEPIFDNVEQDYKYRNTSLLMCFFA